MGVRPPPLCVGRAAAAWHTRVPQAGRNYASAYWRLLARQNGLIRRLAIGSAGIVGRHRDRRRPALWWRLSSGPIQLDVVTPWLAAAIEENFGSHRQVQVGGTQIERTENGGAAVRIRDIVVRDPDGTIVASAPKAEVRVSGMSLLSGHMRAERLNLVGAEMAVRIEPDGEITVFAGANKHPIATAPGPIASVGWRRAPPRDRRPLRDRDRRRHRARRNAAPAKSSPRCCPGSTASARPVSTATICASSVSRDGNLTVDDARTGKQLVVPGHHAQPRAAARRRRRRRPSAPTMPSARGD